MFFWHSMGNRMLTLMSNMLTNLNLSDMEVGYKVFRAEVLKGIDLESKRFGFEPEITVKLAKKRCRFYEVPISYHGRTYRRRQENHLERWLRGAVLHDSVSLRELIPRIFIAFADSTNWAQHAKPYVRAVLSSAPQLVHVIPQCFFQGKLWRIAQLGF